MTEQVGPEAFLRVPLVAKRQSLAGLIAAAVAAAAAVVTTTAVRAGVVAATVVAAAGAAVSAAAANQDDDHDQPDAGAVVGVIEPHCFVTSPCFL